jgi:hypothetical protein
LYRATFIPAPSQLDAIYVKAGFDPQNCRVTLWDFYAKPEEAECDEGKNWAHFDLDPEFQAPAL